MKPKLEAAALEFYNTHPKEALLPVDAWLAYVDNIISKPEDIELTALEDACECYQGEFKDWADMAESLIDNWGILANAPEPIRSYFDYEKYGNDLRLGGDYWENNGHYFRSL